MENAGTSPPEGRGRKKPLPWWVWLVIGCGGGCFLLVFIPLLMGLIVAVFAPEVVEKSQTRGKTEEPRIVEKGQPQVVETFDELALSDVSVSGRTITIVGTTDLPDGAFISVGFDVAGRSPEDTYIGVDSEATIESAKFLANLSIPERPEFKKGPYEISLLFTPKAQTDSVLALVGVNGENLRGPLVNNSLGFKLLEVVKQVELNVGGLTSYHMPNATAFASGSPERTFVNYLLRWKEKDWLAMAGYTQLTWRQNQDSPAEALENFFGIYDVFGVEDVVRSETITSVHVVMSCTVYYALGAEVKSSQLEAHLIKEKAPYTPSENGEWGVNPISMLGFGN